jgi:hypothetical protein
MLLNMLRKPVVPVYRVIALLFVYLAIFGIIGYGAIVGFYLQSSAWIAPFTVNSSDTQVLTIMSQIVASQSALGTLALDAKQTNESLIFSKQELHALRLLDDKFVRVYNDQQKTGAQSAADLQHFDVETQQGLTELQRDVRENVTLRALINRDLANGLITKADAAIAISNIDSLAVQTTSTKVAEKTLLDDIRQHLLIDFNALNVDAQRAQLIFQINQLDSTIRVDEEHARADAAMAETINNAIATAKLSPYYVAVNSPKTIQLAVVPYAGSKVFKAGQPVYECVFGVAVCHYAGKITAVYPNEQIFENPLSHLNVRGYLIQIEVLPESARSKSLVVGSKPFLF